MIFGDGIRSKRIIFVDFRKRVPRNRYLRFHDGLAVVQHHQLFLYLVLLLF